jgi:hypothetical protein
MSGMEPRSFFSSRHCFVGAIFPALAILAEQDPGDKWLEEHPQVLAAIILSIAALNLLFALALLLVAFIVTKIWKLPPWARLALYAPGAGFCAIVLVMLLYVAYLFLGGSPSFR